MITIICLSCLIGKYFISRLIFSMIWGLAIRLGYKNQGVPEFSISSDRDC